MQFTAERNSELDSSRTDLLTAPRTAFATADWPQEGKKKNIQNSRKQDDKYK